MNLENLNFSIAYFSGLASFLSPCLIPLLPSYFSIITGFTLKDLYGLKFKDMRVRFFLSTLFFISGFSIVYSLLGATGTLIGQFLSHYTNILIRLSGFFLILLGLVQVGVLKFKSLEFDYAWNVQRKLSKLGYFSAFVTGIAMALIWIPCVGQFLTGMLILASRQKTALEGLSLLFTFSLGLGTPFVILSLFFPWIFPQLQAHRTFVQRLNLFAGILLIAFGLILIANQYGFYLQFLRGIFPTNNG